MISGLKGTISGYGASKIYLNVSGVEYEVNVPLNVFEKLQMTGKGQDVFLFVYHQFMQDGQKLYGFLDRNQREFFSAVQNIKGLGTALSLSILSHLSAKQLIDLCEKKDVQSLCRIPRIGKSTAETLVFEVGRKIDRWKKVIALDEQGQTQLKEYDDDVVLQALAQLGYRDSQIRSAVDKLKKEISEKKLDFNISEKIQFCLQVI
ncbi:MAG: Holliday junction branch migration protein RuvA [Spirochaetia bacterium]|nr:Holliday junction branch migration protein RuvA [Spirochaetia bacterium]